MGLFPHSYSSHRFHLTMMLLDEKRSKIECGVQLLYLQNYTIVLGHQAYFPLLLWLQKIIIRKVFSSAINIFYNRLSDIILIRLCHPLALTLKRETICKKLWMVLGTSCGMVVIIIVPIIVMTVIINCYLFLFSGTGSFKIWNICANWMLLKNSINL